MTPFGLLLEQLRRSRGLQQQQLAGIVGVNSCYISAMERGRKGPPGKEVVEALIRVLKLSAEEERELRNVIEQSRQVLKIPANTAVHEYELVHSLWKRLGSLSKEETQLILLSLKINHRTGGV